MKEWIPPRPRGSCDQKAVDHLNNPSENFSDRDPMMGIGQMDRLDKPKERHLIRLIKTNGRSRSVGDIVIRYIVISK